MEWLVELVTGTGIAHSILVLALVISLGLLLGKIKIFGISLGTTWILFFGIFLGHLGLEINELVLHFLREFGLILFIYSIGMQVGPSFFSSFKQGGVTLNMLATGVVLLGVTTAYIIHVITGVPIATMVGILSGAVTNTPGLGAAQQTYADMTGTTDPTIATAYAVAYPLGVVGIILSLILFRYIFKINLQKEDQGLDDHKVNIKAGTKPAGTPHVFEDLFAGNYRVVATDPDACSVTEEYVKFRKCHAFGVWHFFSL